MLVVFAKYKIFILEDRLWRNASLSFSEERKCCGKICDVLAGVRVAIGPSPLLKENVLTRPEPPFGWVLRKLPHWSLY